MKKWHLFLGIVFFFFSCQEKSSEKESPPKIDIYDREYYPNGGLKKEIRYVGGDLRNKNITYYYANGKISKKCEYLGDKLNGEFESFDEKGNLLSKGLFKDGIAIGPTYYYTKGNLSLYNERDLHNEVYYVKKYDSLTLRLVKEEGVCLSSKPFFKKYNNTQELYFSYAQPDGYINDLKAEIDGQAIKFDTLKGHLGLIKFKVPESIGKIVKIYSTLKFNSQLICQDSLQEVIVPLQPL